MSADDFRLLACADIDKLSQVATHTRKIVTGGESAIPGVIFSESDMAEAETNALLNGMQSQTNTEDREKYYAAMLLYKSCERDIRYGAVGRKYLRLKGLNQHNCAAVGRSLVTNI